MSFLNTIFPEQEIISRKAQIWHYVGLTVLLLICGLLCTLIGVTVTEWRNSAERQKLIDSYSVQIGALTDKVLTAQADQINSLGETKEVIYEVRTLVSELATTSAKVKASARQVDEAAKRTQNAAEKIKTPRVQRPTLPPPAAPGPVHRQQTQPVALPPQKPVYRPPSVYQN